MRNKIISSFLALSILFIGGFSFSNPTQANSMSIRDFVLLLINIGAIPSEKLATVNTFITILPVDDIVSPTPSSTTTLSYTLTYTADEYGTISGTPVQVIIAGGNGTEVKAVPKSNYRFTKWSDGLKTNPRIDTNITADKSVTANFVHHSSGGGGSSRPAVQTYTLTYSAGAGGTISGSASQTVTSGGAGSAITAVPDEGYTFVSWSDEVTTATRTDTNITANKSVTASFSANTPAPVTYTVVYDAHGGTPAFSTTTDILSNATTTLPEETTRIGYTFDSWNTQADGLGETFTEATPITGDITVYAKWVYDGICGVSGDATDTECWSTPVSDISWEPIGVITNVQSNTDGRANTLALVALDGSYPAARYCNALTEGGVPAGTWYLPAINQLVAGLEEYKTQYNLGNRTWGGFADFTLYWSSTENSGNPEYGAWVAGYGSDGDVVNSYSFYKDFTNVQTRCAR